MTENSSNDSRLTIGMLYSLSETASDQEYLEAILKHAAHIFFPLEDEKTVELTAIGPEGDTILHLACGMGDLRAVRILVEAGLDIEAKGELNETPLFCAIGILPHLDVIQFLLKHGANPDAENGSSYSPRKWAIQMNYKTVLEMFEKV